MAYDNPIIKKRFEEKMKRLDKTSLSILVSWAINNAVDSLTDEMKDNFELAEKVIKARFPFFIDLYREWMLENLPTPEPPKLIRQDFVDAAREAPEKQIAQRVADEIGGEGKVADEKQREANKVDEINRGL